MAGGNYLSVFCTEDADGVLTELLHETVCPMKSTSEMTHLNALAFLYDHLMDFPAWIRHLTRGQLENIARIMVAWTTVVDGRAEIVPMEEIEKREVFRAIKLCGGDVAKAAEALKMGRTTIYRKLKQPGYSGENRALTHQASALAHIPQKERAMFCSPDVI